MNENFDATRLTLLLTELRLPATKQMWSTLAEQSDKEGWPAARLPNTSRNRNLECQKRSRTRPYPKQRRQRTRRR